MVSGSRFQWLFVSANSLVREFVVSPTAFERLRRFPRNVSEHLQADSLGREYRGQPDKICGFVDRICLMVSGSRFQWLFVSGNSLGREYRSQPDNASETKP